MKSVCGGCTIIFNSVAAFDKHRTGEYGKSMYSDAGKVIGRTPSVRRCLTIPEMQAIGMVQNSRGWWIESEPDEATKEYFRRRGEEKEALEH